MATFITAISSIVTASVGWIGSGVSAITSNPLLELFVLFGMCGVGIGLVRRIIG